MEWKNIQGLQSKKYSCGYCGNSLASEKGWVALFGNSGHLAAQIYVCHQCNSPTYFDNNGRQTPGIVFGTEVQDIPDKSVASLYQEARRCTSAGAFTAAVLCARKLLMHIAVSKGAKEGESFVSYVEFLAAKNFIPPDAREWVDHIRAKGNEANHEISTMSKDDAEELISFSAMLLKVIFEFPAAIKKKRPTVVPISTPATPVSPEAVVPRLSNLP